MAAQSRKPDFNVKHNLFKEPYPFSFFKAVHLLESMFPEKKQLGTTVSPAEEPVRFSVKPTLTFPASDISKLMHVDRDRPVDMQVTFMGLIGPAGALPYWYTEEIIERARQKDHTLAAFMDLFHHRLISLFYLAWKKYQFPINYKIGATDRLSFYMLCLLGLGTPNLAGRIGVPEESLSFYCGLLSRIVPTVSSIERTVAYFSDTDVVVDQFVQRLLPLDPEDQTQLGTANAVLGRSALCGSHFWECQSKFRINLGPMSLKKFLRLLPIDKILEAIFSLVKYLVGIEYEFDIRLHLKREEVLPCQLGAKAPLPPMLGWTTFMVSPGQIPDKNPYLTFLQPGL